LKCQRCEGTAKLYEVSAKCSDLYSQIHLKTGKQTDGYVPEWIGAGGYGDYVNFTVCRHCGQIQGNWPESDASIDFFKYGKAL
jgi:hypothetical protein